MVKRKRVQDFVREIVDTTPAPDTIGRIDMNGYALQVAAALSRARREVTHHPQDDFHWNRVVRPRAS